MFDEALDLEQQLIENGRQDGLKDGREAGHKEGHELGLQKGFEIGHEIGFYSGCVQLWRQLQSKRPEFTTARAEKAISALEKQLESFPLDSPKEERLQDLMDGIRGKYKTATVMLGLSEAYAKQGNPEAGLQF